MQLKNFDDQNLKIDLCRRGESRLRRQLPDPVFYEAYGDFLAEPTSSDTPH